MYHKAWWSGAWYPSATGWEGLGGTFNSAPVVDSWADQRLDLFGLGTDNGLYHKAWGALGWNPPAGGWEGLGGTFTG